MCKADGDALYFSRAPIPYARDHFAREGGGETLPTDFPAYRHIGLYAYRAAFLKAYSGLAVSPLEQFECLEQLRGPVARLSHQRGHFRQPAGPRRGYPGRCGAHAQMV